MYPENSTVTRFARRAITFQRRGGMQEGDRLDRGAIDAATMAEGLTGGHNDAITNTTNNDNDNNGNTASTNTPDPNTHIDEANLDTREHRPFPENREKAGTDSCPFNSQFIQLPKDDRVRLNGTYRDMEVHVNYNEPETLDEYRNGNYRRNFIVQSHDKMELHDIHQRAQAVKIVNLALEKAEEEAEKAGKALDGRDVEFVPTKPLSESMTPGLFVRLWLRRHSWRKYRRWFGWLCVFGYLVWHPEVYYPTTPLEAMLNGTAKFYALGTAVMGTLKEENVMEVGEVCGARKVCEVEGNGTILHARHPMMAGR